MTARTILQAKGLQRRFHVPRIHSKVMHLLGRGLCRHFLKELAKVAGWFLSSLEIKGHGVLLAETSRGRSIMPANELYEFGVCSRRGKGGGCPRAKVHEARLFQWCIALPELRAGSA
jgi:hypothetical protein